MKINTKIKSHCRVCNRENNHIVKALEASNESNQEFWYTDEFAIVQCLGCDTFSFRKEYSDAGSAFYDHEEEAYDAGITADVYPPVIKSHRSLKDQWLLPISIGMMYRESIDALSAGCKTLAGAGFRAVIEAVCLDKQVTGDDLKAQINKLAKQNHITPSEQSRLHSIRFLGNDSIHDAKTPTEEQLTLALQIIEHLLTNIYLIDAQSHGKLESIIKEYDGFKRLLTKLLKGFKSGEEYTLYKLFGKDVRRIEDYGQAFEDKLVQEITDGAFTLLTIAPVMPNADSSSTKPMSPRFIVV